MGGGTLEAFPFVQYVRMNGIPFFLCQCQEHTRVRSDPFIGDGVARPVYKSAVGKLAGIYLPDSFLYIRLYFLGLLFVHRLELGDE